MRHNSIVLYTYVSHWPAYLRTRYCSRVGTNDETSLDMKRDMGGDVCEALWQLQQCVCHVKLGKVFKCFTLMIYHENVASNSQYEICYFIMLPVAKILILYHNYREGSEAHCG